MSSKKKRPSWAGIAAQRKGVFSSRPGRERPISPVYPVIDTDLARDNLENDLPAADLEDL